MSEPNRSSAPAGSSPATVANLLPEHAKVVERIADLTARIGELRRHL